MGRIITEISEYFGVDEKLVSNRVRNANKFYRKVEIPKSNGRTRVLYLPSPEIKAFQHLLSELYLTKMKISSNSVGYIKGKSTKDNIVPHLKNSHFLHIDVKDFFDSIDYEVFRKILSQYHEFKFDEVATNEFLSVLTYNKKFVQGSVTSPIVSNIYFKSVDDEIDRLVKSLEGGVYTRYSDDITISSSKIIDSKILHSIILMLAEIRLEINSEKTYFSSNIQDVRITGLNNVEGRRISVGTEYKKKLKNMIFHKQKFGEKSVDSIEKVLGSLMYLRFMEPEYYNKLNWKYRIKDQLLIDQLNRKLKQQKIREKRDESSLVTKEINQNDSKG